MKNGFSQQEYCLLLLMKSTFRNCYKKVSMSSDSEAQKWASQQNPKLNSDYNDLYSNSIFDFRIWIPNKWIGPTKIPKIALTEAIVLNLGLALVCLPFSSTKYVL